MVLWQWAAMLFWKPGRGGRLKKSSRNFKFDPEGGRGGAMEMGRVAQRPGFDRAVVHDGLYDYHQERV
jgi:hypothetical protein